MSMFSQEPLEDFSRFDQWITTYHYAHFRETAEVLPLRRDAVTVLTYARDHDVVGTRSTGNMPLKHVRAVTAAFVDPPVLDGQGRKRPHSLRSEFEVWPLFFLHALLEDTGLLETPQGARWQLTDAGYRFLEIDALLQTLSLYIGWWYRVDWRIASNHDIELPRALYVVTLSMLLSQPIGTWIDFKPFAETIIERSGLARALKGPPGSELRKVMHMILLWDIQEMVVDRLIDFAGAQARFQGDEEDDQGFREVEAFKLTWFGKALLEGVNL